MSAAPRVSVVIPCRDAAGTLPETLASVLDQRWPEVEIVVVDDGSTDASGEAVERALAGHRGPWRVLSNRGRGANAARETGLAATDGDYLQWLDADDLLLPGKFEREVAALAAHRGDDVAHGDWIWEQTVSGLAAAPGERVPFVVPAIAYGDRDWRRTEDRADVLRARFSTGPSDDYLLRLLMDWWAPPHTYLLRASAARWLHEQRAWHPDMRAATDRGYYTTAAVHGFRFRHVPVAGAAYRTRPGSGQMTAGITPAERAASLAALQARLAGLPRRAQAPPLTAQHRALLQQDRRLWVAAPPAAAGDTQHLAAAMLLRGLRRAPHPDTLEEHAKRLAWLVPGLWERHLQILDALHRMAARGLLRAVS